MRVGRWVVWGQSCDRPEEEISLRVGPPGGIRRSIGVEVPGRHVVCPGASDMPECGRCDHAAPVLAIKV
jgi:hypothetical protein